MQTDSIQKALRVSLLYDHIFYFHAYPWRNRPKYLYTEFTEGFFGDRLIEQKSAGGPAVIKYWWYDFLSVLTKVVYNSSTVIKIYGFPTLSNDIAGCDISNAAAILDSNADAAECKTFVICYNGLTNGEGGGTPTGEIVFVYNSVNYQIPVEPGLNYVGFRVLPDKIVIYSNNQTTEQAILLSDDPPFSDAYQLQIRDIKLYALNIYPLLSQDQLIFECNLIKDMALKRLY